MNREPNWYKHLKVNARYVEETLPVTGKYQNLSKLTDEQLETSETRATRNKRASLIDAIRSEKKRRYIVSAIKWIRETCTEMPETEEERRSYIARANEIFRRGFNDFQDELISIWPDIQEIAEYIVEGIGDCSEKTAYDVSKKLVGAVVVNFWEKDIREKAKHPYF